MIAHLNISRSPCIKTNLLSDEVDDFSVFSNLELIISKINYREVKKTMVLIKFLTRMFIFGVALSNE